jgi:ribosomal protein L17
MRGLPTDRIRIRETPTYDAGGALTGVALAVDLPPDFPEKYKEALVRTIERCSVKRAIAAQPSVTVTLAKKGGLSNRRLAHARLLDDTQLKKLFDVLAGRYAERNGGYTRIVKAGIRASDGAPMAIIEFVDRDVSAKGQDSGPVQGDEDYAEAA